MSDTVLKLPVVLIGLSAQGLALLRSFARNGYHVVAFSDCKKQVGCASRYGEHRLFHGMADLKWQIEELATRFAPQKLHCVIASGEALAEILKDYPEIYLTCTVESAPLDVVIQFSCKDQVYARAKERNIPCLDYRLLNDYRQGDLTFPLVLKRNREVHFPDKVKFFRTQPEMDRYCQKLDQALFPDLILQPLIELKRQQEITCQLYCKQGQVIACFTALQYRKLKKGITSMLYELPDDEKRRKIENYARIFLQGSGYSGFIELEFFCDESFAEIFLMDVNPRPCGTHSAFMHKYPQLCRFCAEENWKNLELYKVPERIKWVNVIRDIRARLEQKDCSGLWSVFQCRTDVLDWRDLAPFIRQFFK